MMQEDEKRSDVEKIISDIIQTTSDVVFPMSDVVFAVPAISISLFGKGLIKWGVLFSLLQYRANATG